jgi:hypothetical protein
VESGEVQVVSVERKEGREVEMPGVIPAKSLRIGRDCGGGWVG